MHRAEYHGHILEDPYHWLRDPAFPEVKDPDVLAYISAENDYFDAAMAPHQKLIDTLFEEMKGRIKEDDSSVPVRDGAFLYWWAFEPGAHNATFEAWPDNKTYEEAKSGRLISPYTWRFNVG